MKIHVCHILLSLFILVFPAFAQEGAGLTDDADEVEFLTDPEEQAIVLPSGVNFEESSSLEDVVEAVGTIIYGTVPIYSSANKSSAVTRYALPQEKMIITASDGLWYRVRTYSGKEGFVEKRHLKTVKVFYDESVTANYMDKRINVELNNLVQQFNRMLMESVYIDKFQIVPRIALVGSIKRNNVITLTLEYSAVDRFGSVIPSRQSNALSKQMRGFLELLFLKMLPSGADSYQIIVRKPEFSFSGRVLNMQGAYAEISLKHEDIDIAAIKERKSTILSVARSSIPADKLFYEYPN